MKIKQSLLPLFLCIFIDSIGWGIVFPVLDSLIIGNVTGLIAVHASIDQKNMYYELLIGVYCLAMFLASPVLGAYSDQYGRKKLLIVALVGGAIGFLVCGIGVLFDSLLILFVGRIIAGLTAGNLAVAQAAIADYSNQDTLPKNLSFMVIANGTGFACGPILGGLLFNTNIFSHVSYLSPFILMSVLLLSIALYVRFSFIESNQSLSTNKVTILLGLQQLYNAFSFVSVRTYFTVLLIFMVGYTIFFSNLPIFFSEKFADSGTSVGYVLTYFAIIFTIALIVLLPKVTKKFKLINISLCCLLLQCLFSICFLFSLHQLFFFIPLTVIAICVPFIYVTQVSLISERTSGTNQGKAMGVVGSIAAASWGIGPLATAFLSDFSSNVVFSVSIVFLFIGFLVLLKATRKV